MHARTNSKRHPQIPCTEIESIGIEIFILMNNEHRNQKKKKNETKLNCNHTILYVCGCTSNFNVIDPRSLGPSSAKHFAAIKLFLLSTF